MAIQNIQNTANRLIEILEDGEYFLEVYNPGSSAVAENTLVKIVPSVLNGQPVYTIVSITADSAGLTQLAVVTNYKKGISGIPATSFGFVKIKGLVALTIPSGVSITAGRYLKVNSTGTYSEDTSMVTGSFAVALEGKGSTGSAAVKFWLIGRNCTVAT